MHYYCLDTKSNCGYSRNTVSHCIVQNEQQLLCIRKRWLLFFARLLNLTLSHDEDKNVAYLKRVILSSEYFTHEYPGLFQVPLSIYSNNDQPKPSRLFNVKSIHYVSNVSYSLRIDLLYYRIHWSRIQTYMYGVGFFPLFLIVTSKRKIHW